MYPNVCVANKMRTSQKICCVRIILFGLSFKVSISMSHVTVEKGDLKGIFAERMNGLGPKRLQSLQDYSHFVITLLGNWICFLPHLNIVVEITVSTKMVYRSGEEGLARSSVCGCQRERERA